MMNELVMKCRKKHGSWAEEWGERRGAGGGGREGESPAIGAIWWSEQPCVRSLDAVLGFTLYA